jgi:hypothetical protein
MSQTDNTNALKVQIGESIDYENVHIYAQLVYGNLVLTKECDDLNCRECPIDEIVLTPEVWMNMHKYINQLTFLQNFESTEN